MDDLKPHFTTGRTKARILAGLYIMALVRYSDYSSLQACKKQSLNKHIFTKPFLQILSDNGYIQDSGFYTITPKTISALSGNYPISHLQKRLQGEYGEHQKRLTEVILAETNSPEFFTAFYSSFEFGLIPDACVIYRQMNKAKLVFFEIERTDKPKEYLEDKKRKYNQLARSEWVYSKWWVRQCEIFNFKLCPINEFGFSLKVVK
jgi:hypothetical protein